MCSATITRWVRLGLFLTLMPAVIQFGYVTLFAASFPITAVLALLNNLIEIRTDAMKLLDGTRRPKYSCAADIGTWAVVLDVLITACIITNVLLVGFTSHGLFFYFGELTSVKRIWTVILIEVSDGVIAN